MKKTLGCFKKTLSLLMVFSLIFDPLFLSWAHASRRDQKMSGLDLGEDKKPRIKKSFPKEEKEDKKSPPTFSSFLDNLYYTDADISEYIESTLHHHLLYTYREGHTYLLTERGKDSKTIRDQEDGISYLVAVASALDTAGKKNRKNFSKDYDVSSLNIGYHFDKATRPPDVKEDILKIIQESKVQGKTDEEISLEIQKKIDDPEMLKEGIPSLRTRLEKEVLALQKTKTDVFEELMPHVFKEDSCHIKILFPYNRTEFHWLTGEIRIHKEKNNYSIEIFAHDPMGRGEMEDIPYNTLKETIEKRILSYHPAAEPFSFKRAQSPYGRRQAEGDEVSCGVIVADDIIKRISKWIDSRPYPCGALITRKAHIKVVKKANEDSPFILRNKVRIKMIKKKINNIQKAHFSDREIDPSYLSILDREEEEEFNFSDGQEDYVENGTSSSAIITKKIQKPKQGKEKGTQKSLNLRVALLNENVNEVEKAVNKKYRPSENQDTEWDTQNGIKILIKNSPAKVSAPMNFLLSGLPHRNQEILTLPLYPTGGLAFIEVKNRRFVYSFGRARHLLNENKLDPIFGIRMIGNQVGSKSFTQVKTEEFSIRKQVQTTYAEPTSFNRFSSSADGQPCLLNSVSAQIPDNDTTGKKRKRTISGSSKYYRSTKRIKFDDLPKECEDLLDKFEKKTYLTQFSFLKDFNKITDKNHIKRLKKHFFDKKDEIGNYSILIPSDLFDKVYGKANECIYKFIENGNSSLFYDIEEFEDFLLQKISASSSPTNFDTLLRSQCIILDSDKQEEWENKLYNWVVFEWLDDEKGSMYLLRNGIWVEFKKRSVDKIRDVVKGLVEQAPLDKLARGDNEKGHNIKLVEKNKDWILFDGYTPPIDSMDPQHSILEFCDILNPARDAATPIINALSSTENSLNLVNKPIELIHVKIGNNSNKLCHLFHQGRSSFDALLNHRDFRRETILKYTLEVIIKEVEKWMKKKWENRGNKKHEKEKDLFIRIGSLYNDVYKTGIDLKVNKENFEKLIEEKIKKKRNLTPENKQEIEVSFYTEEKIQKFFHNFLIQAERKVLNEMSNDLFKNPDTNTWLDRYLKAYSEKNNFGFSVDTDLEKEIIEKKVRTFMELIPLEKFNPQNYKVVYLVGSTKGGSSYTELPFPSLMSLASHAQHIQSKFGNVGVRLFDASVKKPNGRRSTTGGKKNGDTSRKRLKKLINTKKRKRSYN